MPRAVRRPRRPHPGGGDAQRPPGRAHRPRHRHPAGPGGGAGGGPRWRLSIATRDRLQPQAQLQLAERETGTARSAAPPSRARARAARARRRRRLPRLRGRPVAGDGAGRSTSPASGPPGSSASSGRTTSPRRAGWTTALLDWTHRAAGHAHPGMHVYHYAPYETTALKRLVGRTPPARPSWTSCCAARCSSTSMPSSGRACRISKESYSIKKLEEFYWGRTRDPATPRVSPKPSPQRRRVRAVALRSDDGTDQAILDDIRPTTRTTSTRPATCTVAGGAAGRTRGRGGGAHPTRARAGKGDRRRGAGRDRARRASRRRGPGTAGRPRRLAPP